MQVEQIDREAAARLIALWDDGDLHCDDFTEAFARHRIAERERVVGEIVAWLREQGIASTGSEADNGWWETSTGAEFGESILDQIEANFGGCDGERKKNAFLQAPSHDLTGP
ncbi:hypothetical protein ACQKOE_10035 [Novosphingobium sp. NPDC080210]|uniref:hypothetical protein n=1 Tax=Novosphingobium sp. NPDC080210 TaxID=3390596 RepID=UPI003CFDA38E